MKANITMLILSVLALPANAQTDTLKAQQLEGVTVSRQYIQQTADHYNCIPTAKQRRHSHSGLELVRNMMIPGVDVDTESGTISTPAGAVTLYINGREATYREIKSLRSKDITRIEYYDMPTGKYAKDRAVLNYIVKNYRSGGYTQVEALQGAGYRHGSYDLVSKYSFGNYNANLWAGYNYTNPKEDAITTEHYSLTGMITKDTWASKKDKDNREKYITASLSNMTSMRAWMLRASLEASKQWNNICSGGTEYMMPQGIYTLARTQYSLSSTVKPTLYAYYQRNIGKNHRVDAVLDGYYANNKYRRDLHDDGIFTSDVDEDFFYGKFNANYGIALPRRNSLTFSLHEYMRVSQDRYATREGNAEYSQHLRSSETLLLADYNKRWDKAMFDISPGMSYLAYKLHGDETVSHLAPRLQLSSSWLPDKSQRLRFSFSLGNTFPTLGTVNHVDQRIDRVMIRRGNPDMDNSTLLSPSLTYSLNYKQVSASLSCYYLYASNAIVNTYYVEDGNIINSYSSDASSHQSTVSLSLTWKPSSSFNVKWYGRFANYILHKAAEERQKGWQTGLQANYYAGDFSFSASCKSPTRSLANYQYHVKQPWQYGLSAEWSHDNIAVVLEAKNLFVQGNEWHRCLSSGIYDVSERFKREGDNSYASLKLVCSIDYGKRVHHSPRYEMKDAESTFLR